MLFLTGFFIRNGFHSRRTMWLALICAVPVLIVLALAAARSAILGPGVSLSALFPQVSFFLFLRFLLPLMAVFVGTAVIGEEVDDRTLPYLMVRPIPRWQIVISKTAAAILTMAVLLCVSLGLTYTLMTADSGIQGWGENIPGLLHAAGVFFIGLLVYIPLFVFLGGVMKKSVLAGLIFTFGWENTVAFFPGNVKLFTVLHYLNVIYPQMEKTPAEQVKSELLNFILPTYKISPVLAILILFLMCVLFTALAASLLYIKEYRLEME